MTRIYEGGWADAAELLRPVGHGDLARLDAAAVERTAFLLDVPASDVVIAMRGMARLHGTEIPPFEIGVGTWRIDLPKAVAKSVMAGMVTATVLRLLGAGDLPLTVLGAIAPLVLDVRRVDVAASDVVVQAQLAGAAAGQARDARDLYRALPEDIRGELTAAGFADVLERLAKARQIEVGREGLRVRSPGARRGFRLVLWDAPLLPHLLVLHEQSKLSTLESGVPTWPVDVPARLAGPGTAARPGAYNPRVFISYAQESPEHMARVRAFGRLLSSCGMRVRLDQWGLTDRRDWQTWATDGITSADYVLVIASPVCRTVGDGREAPGMNLGLAAEMRTIRELYHSDYGTWRRKVLPVVLPGGTVEGIPLFLQPRTADHYKVLDLSVQGAEDLLRLMTGQPVVTEPALGETPLLPPEDDGAA